VQHKRRLTLHEAAAVTIAAIVLITVVNATLEESIFGWIAVAIIVGAALWLLRALSMRTR
jgi:hypothetical protein